MVIQKIDLFIINARRRAHYRLEIHEAEGGFRLFYANNRIDGVMTNKPKLPGVVTLAAATKKFDQVVREKRSEGYTEDRNGVAFGGSSNAGEFSNIACMLPSLMAREDVQSLIDDPAWWAQEKMDGEHRLAAHGPSQAPAGVNRRGLFVPLAGDVSNECSRLASQAILDAEVMAPNNHLVAFDALEIEGEDLRGLPFSERWARLEALPLTMDGPIRLVRVAKTASEKAALLERVQAEQGEGLVFKRADSTYEAGKVGTRGNHRKYKFRHSASVIVTGFNDRRSLTIGVLSPDGEILAAGSVGIPEKCPTIEIGDIAEVTYRDAFASGALREPVFKGLRSDIIRSECSVEQLVFQVGAKPTANQLELV